MEYDFNANESGNDINNQSAESEGDSITIDNNDKINIIHTIFQIIII